MKNHTSLSPLTRVVAWWQDSLVPLPALSIAFIYAFARLASEVTARETTTFDRVVRTWTITHSSSWLDLFFGVVTRFGSWYSLVIAAAILIALLVRHGAKQRPLIIAATPFCLSLIVFLLKGWYRIDRPPTGLASALTFSFPSGHTSGSTAAVIVFGYVLSHERVVSVRTSVLIAVVAPVLVGMSRIYLDMHWASDVIGGWMIGAAYGAAVCALYERAHRRSLAATASSPEVIA